MPTVSLVVPVYKADEWIEQCLASIKAQTYKDIQLIVIDDPQGSGAAEARNRGLAKAAGEFVAFCDADDYLEPDAIEKMVTAMNGADMVLGAFRKFGDFNLTVQHPAAEFNMRDVAQYAMSNLKNPRDSQLLSGCWAKLYRHSLIGRFPNLTTAEDMAFNFDYLNKCRSVKIIPDVVYHNRKRQGSLSTSYEPVNKAGLFGFLRALNYVRKFLTRFYDAAEVEDAIDNSKVYHSMLYYKRICDQMGWSTRETLMRLYP